eukprot:gene11422-21622_t
MDLQDSAASASMHGFGRIFITKSKVLRLVWICFMILFVALLAYFLTPVLKRYFSNPSVTKEETVIAPRIRFPAITICGAGMSKEKLDKFGKLHNKSFEMYDDVEGIGFSRDMREEDIFQKLGTHENIKGVMPEKEKLFLKNLSGSCMFKMQSGCNLSTDIDTILVVERGYCFRINPNGTYFQSRAGPGHGLAITFFLNTSDKVPWTKSNNGDSIEAIIGYHDEYPFPSIGSVLIPVGHSTQVELGKTEIERLPPPFPSKCTNGDNMPLLLYPGEYSIQNCQESCFAFKVSDKCDSLDFYTNTSLPKELKKPFPKTEEDFLCGFRIYENLEKTNFASCKCPLSCYETKFTKTISYSRWPSAADMPIYKKLFSKALGMNISQVTDKFVERNFMRLNIFFGDMTYNKVKETKMYTADKLISEIGGLMGIWIGASMFSLLEILFLLVQVIQYGFGSKKLRKENDLTLENTKT